MPKLQSSVVDFASSATNHSDCFLPSISYRLTFALGWINLLLSQAGWNAFSNLKIYPL